MFALFDKIAILDITIEQVCIIMNSSEYYQSIIEIILMVVLSRTSQPFHKSLPVHTAAFSYVIAFS